MVSIGAIYIFLNVLTSDMCVGLYMKVFSDLLFCFSGKFSANLLSAQLRMFDLNGDGKLGLSEMAR